MTNPNKLFSDAIIQLAVFKGNTRAVFLDRKIADGPIDQQIEEAMLFVQRNIRMGSRIEKLCRLDIYELPLNSIRAMISWAVCNRSYITPGSIQVAVYDNRLEITSPGSITSSITLDEFIEGRSLVRNKAIASAFNYMHIIDHWGSGIPQIIKESKDYGLKDPEIKALGDAFRICLFRKPFDFDSYGVTLPKFKNAISQTINDTNKSLNDTNEFINDNEKRILHLLQNNPLLTQKELSELAQISTSTVKRTTISLQKKKLLQRKGSQKQGEWIVLLPTA